MVIQKIKEKFNNLKTRVTDWLDIVKGLQNIISEQNKVIRKLSEDKVELYNLAVDRILGPGYRLEVYRGPNAFWDGRKGIKSKIIVDVYRKRQDMVEIPVSFESSGSVWYWYFLELDKEVEV